MGSWGFSVMKIKGFYILGLEEKERYIVLFVCALVREKEN